MVNFRSLNLNFITVLSVVSFLMGIVFVFLASGGIVIAVTFFSKIFIVLSLISFLFSVLLFFLRKKIKVR